MRSRFAVAMVALLLSGCQALRSDERPEPLTRETYETAESARAGAIHERLDELADEQDRRLREQQQRLDRLGQRLDEVLARLRARREAAEATTGDDADGDDAGAEPVVGVDLMPAENTLVFGSRECVVFPEQGIVLRGRVDSGATTSSLNATDIEEFERDGQSWVRFRIAHNGPDEETPEEVADAVGDGEEADAGEDANAPPADNENDDGGGEPARPGTPVEAEVERRVIIRQATGEERRVVVSLPVHIGPLREEAEFTLTDRGELSTPVLIGRRLMMDVALIDVARNYVQPCPDA